MNEISTIDEMIDLLIKAIGVADALGATRIACHIDHALALARETALIGTPAPPLQTNSVM